MDGFGGKTFSAKTCPFYSEWSTWSWIKEGNRESPIKIMDGSYDRQKNKNGLSLSCHDTCGKRIRTRERKCYEINLKG